jgi:uncharacterized protein (UPF0332 family)
LTELIDRLLERSATALAAAARAADAGDAETAANRAYYSMFYAASALLATEGVVVRRHSATHAAFGARFVKSGRMDPTHHRALLTAFDLRQLADYDAMATISVGSARQSIDDARAFLEATRTTLAP